MLIERDATMEEGRSPAGVPGSSVDIRGMIESLLRTLAQIDESYAQEMAKADASASDEELKKYIKEKILARHREKRQPYVDLLADLHRHARNVSTAA